MSETELKSLFSIPKWDGTHDTCGRYLSQIKALAEYHECGDALDESEMVNFPIKAAYTLLDKADATNATVIALYKTNRRLCVIMIQVLKVSKTSVYLSQCYLSNRCSLCSLILSYDLFRSFWPYLN